MGVWVDRQLSGNSRICSVKSKIKTSARLLLNSVIVLVFFAFVGSVFAINIDVNVSCVNENPDDDPLCDDGETYNAIQPAIDAAVDGDTINVAAGDYQESLVIDKTLTLIGDAGDESAGPGSDAPVIINSENWRLISVEAEGVIIRGFFLDGATDNGPVIRIDQYMNNTIIEDNEIRYSGKGIDLAPYSHDNMIINNIIHEIHDNGNGNNWLGQGIWIGGSTQNTISGNEIYENDYGIVLGEGGCGGNNGGDGCVGDISGNVITSNNIYSNDYSGVYVSDSNGVLTFTKLDITSNNITANGVNGNDYGIYFDTVSDSTDWLTISNNKITDNSYEGVYIYYVINSNINLSKNNISGNGGDYAGVYIYSVDAASQVNINSNNVSENYASGIYLDQGEIGGVANVDVTNNIIADNDYYGLYFEQITDSTDDLIIRNNKIIGNGNDGLWITYVTNSNVSISENNITGNGADPNEGGSYYGLYIYSADENSKVDISSNNVSENSRAGIYFGNQITNADITSNNIDNNGDLGIYVYQVSGSTDWLAISSNTIVDNGNEGLWVNYVTSSNVNISENNITGNGRYNGDYYGEIYGVIIYSSDESSQVKIDSNNMSENSGPGIYLGNNEGEEVTNVDIINNYIMNNNKGNNSPNNASIIILYALGNKAHSNNIISEKDDFALDNQDPEPLNQFNATNNYWGSSNPDFAAIISGNVSYTPWYIDSALTMTSSSQVGENQTLADEEEETINENTTEVIVPVGSPLKQVVVNTTDSSKDVNISLANLKNATGEVKLVNNFTLTRQASGINYAAEIPSGTVISGGSDWDGKINVPTIKNAADFSASSGSVDVVVDVGSGSEINFSDKVKVTIGGKAGKTAAWARGTSALTAITTVCDSAASPTNINAVSPRECYIDSGSDLLIWTYHFTQFAAVTAASTSGDSGGGGGAASSGGSSGGGSCAPGYSLENYKCVKTEEKPAEKAPAEKAAEEAVTAPEEEPEEEPLASQPQAQQQGGLAGITGRAISALAKPNKIVSVTVLILVLSGLYGGYYYLYRKKQ